MIAVGLRACLNKSSQTHTIYSSKSLGRIVAAVRGCCSSAATAKPLLFEALRVYRRRASKA